MSNEIQAFDYHGSTVRSVVDGNGDPWFLAKDVCGILGTYTKDLRSVLEPDEISNVDNIDIAQNGGKPPLIISEPGLYSLTLRSRKPEAKKFHRWVTHEVLPAIRKHGAYMTESVAERALNDPDFLIRIATRLKAERRAREEAERTIEAQKPKVLFADSVETSRTSILVGAFANDLRQNGVNIGQNRLFAWLRDHGYLISRKGEGWNMPTQRALDLGLFEVKTRTINNPDGSVRTTRTTKITGKGRIYLTEKLLAPTTGGKDTE